MSATGPSAWRQALRYAGGIIPPAWRDGPVYRTWSRFLLEAQYWPAERIQGWQLEQLRRIVRLAYEGTEGYRVLYDRAGVHPDDLRAIDDLARFPLVTKQDIQQDLEAFSLKSGRRRYASTGGSTGVPFGFYKRPSDGKLEWAFMHAGWRRAGWRRNGVSAILRGGFIGSAEHWWEYNPYRRELYLSSYYLTRDTARAYLDKMRQYDARILQAYPSSCHMLADLLLEHGASSWGPELILLGSENVYDWQLRKAESVFPAARFFAWYGQSEQVILAPWCEQTRICHAWPFYGWTEVVDAAGREIREGETGELVGTSFHVTATPFIRYRTSDVAVKGAERCEACGRHGRLLSRIEGRTHELLVTTSGRHISMTAINMHDRIFEPVRQFLFYQEVPGQAEFRYVPKRPLTSEEVDRMRHGLMNKLGGDMILVLQPVAEIPRSASGKMRFLDQRLPVRYLSS